MAGKLTGAAARKAETLEQAGRKWDHVRSLVERVASGGGGDVVALMRSIARAATDVARVLENNGFSGLGQSAADLASVVQRAKVTPGKLRTMREQVAGVRSAIDSAERQLHREATQGEEAS